LVVVATFEQLNVLTKLTKHYASLVT